MKKDAGQRASSATRGACSSPFLDISRTGCQRYHKNSALAATAVANQRGSRELPLSTRQRVANR